MFRVHHNLDCDIISRLKSDVGRQRYLRQTDALSRVGFVRRAIELEDGYNVVGVILGNISEPHVYVEKGSEVTLEPARFKGDCAAGNGPLGPIGGDGHAAAWWGRNVSIETQVVSIKSAKRLTWIHPLHPVGECVRGELVDIIRAICDEIVSSPSGICHIKVRCCPRPCCHKDQERAKGMHGGVPRRGFSQEDGRSLCACCWPPCTKDVLSDILNNTSGSLSRFDCGVKIRRRYPYDRRNRIRHFAYCRSRWTFDVLRSNGKTKVYWVTGLQRIIWFICCSLSRAVTSQKTWMH